MSNLCNIKYQISNIFKFFFVFLLLNIYFFIFTAAPVSAQTSQLPTNVSPTSPIYTDLLVHNLFHSFSCLAIGGSVIGQPCLTYQITQNAQGAIQSVPVLSQVNLSGGTLGAVTSVIGMLYANPPVRTVDYLASVGQGLGIVKEAKAQVVGSGAKVLNPIISLWQVSRNIAYLVMIIIFVIIGLMVMFRSRINPQTVITAQAALPGLVIGLILITFSYFFAALLVDTAFIGTNIVGYYFVAAQPPPPTPPPCLSTNLVDCTKNENVLTIMGKLINGIGKDPITDGVGTFFNSLVDPASRFVRAGAALAAYQVGSGFGGALGALAGITTCGIAALPFITIPGINLVALGGTGACSVIAAQVGSTIGSPLAGGILATKTAQDPPAMVGLALWFIAMAIIIYSMFRLLVRLVNNFLSIIFLVVTAPFHFLAASLPGRQEIATGWILNMLCNVLAFPAVMAVFYFINYLLGSQDIKESPFQITSAGAAGLTGTETLPLFGDLSIFTIRILLAFGALVITPAIPDIICRTIGRLGVAGQLIGQEFGAGVAGGRGYLGQAQGAFGGMQRDIGGLGGLRGQYNYQILPGGGIGVMEQPGAIGRLAGRPPRLVRIIPPLPPAPCLPPYAQIATPFGPKAIVNIRRGDIVWTIDDRNEKKKAQVKEVVKRRVLANHKILWLVLADGRELYVSPGHPDATNRDLALLKRGDYFDHSRVVKTELSSYDNKYTYDILPEGKIGAYWANNILIGSTLTIENKNLLFLKFGLTGLTILNT